MGGEHGSEVEHPKSSDVSVSRRKGSIFLAKSENVQWITDLASEDLGSMRIGTSATSADNYVFTCLYCPLNKLAFLILVESRMFCVHTAV